MASIAIDITELFRRLAQSKWNNRQFLGLLFTIGWANRWKVSPAVRKGGSSCLTFLPELEANHLCDDRRGKFWLFWVHLIAGHGLTFSPKPGRLKLRFYRRAKQRIYPFGRSGPAEDGIARAYAIGGGGRKRDSVIAVMTDCQGGHRCQIASLCNAAGQSSPVSKDSLGVF